MSRSRSQIGKSNSRTAKAHERRVRDLLNEWCGEEQFRRRRVTGNDNATVILDKTGDVISLGREPRFNIEAKKGKTFSITALLINPDKCQFTEWYFQSAWDASLATQRSGTKTYPMVFLKPNVNEDWIAISIPGFDTLKAKDDRALYAFPHLRFDHYGLIGHVEGDVSHSAKKPKIERIELDPCLFCRWKDFAAHIDPDSFFQCVAAETTKPPE